MPRAHVGMLAGAVLALVLGGARLSAQDEGIRFERGLTWPEVQARAQQENKFIFLAWRTTRCDGTAATRWADPSRCEEADRQLYALRQVGEFFNRGFISVSVPVGSATQEDAAVAVSWSALVRDLERQYEIPPFYGLVFLSPDGVVVHRAAWTAASVAGLLAAASDALDPQRQYYTLLAQYRNGRRDIAAMQHLARTARTLGERDVAARIATDAGDYINRAEETDLLTRDKIAFMREFTARSSDRGFTMFRQHAERINQVMDSAGYAERLIDRIVTQEELTPRLKPDEPFPDWPAIASAIAVKHGADAAERIVARAKARSWSSLNGDAWALFTGSNDLEKLRQAVAWMQRVVQQQGDKPDPNHLDTYANLLYKVGRVDEAIAWLEKALALTDPRAWYYESTREHLALMKKGEPTWPHQ